MSQNRENKGGKRLQKTNKKSASSKAGAQKSAAKKPQSAAGKKTIFQSKGFIVLTVIAAIIVAVYVFWELFSAPPAIKPVDLPPEVTTTTDPEGNTVEVVIDPEFSLRPDQKKEHYTFLLVGQDTYGGGNTDTMMLASYNVKEQTLNVMSLPRDTYVNYNGQKVLLNSVYNRAGGKKNPDVAIAALKKEVGDLTGIYPNYHAIVQWEAVGELVDAIGGVDYNVPARMYYNDLSQHFKIDLKPGMQHMDGSKAMQLVRWRKNSDDKGNAFGGYSNGDLGRIQTQQSFMKEIIKKCLQPTVLLPNLTEYINIFQRNVVTDLDASALTYFAKSAVGGLNMDNVEFHTLPNRGAGDAHLVPVGDELVKLVNEKFNPYDEPIERKDLDLVTSTANTSMNKPGGTINTTAPSAKPSATTKPDESPKPSQSRKPEDKDPDESGGALLPPGEGEDEPRQSGKPSASPKPTASRKPGESAKPTPEAENTPKPTATPKPEPSATPKPEPPTQAPNDEPLLPPGE